MSTTVRDVALRAAWLTAVWVALWGDASWGPVVAGAALALALQAVIAWPAEQPMFRRFRPLAVARFVVYFVGQLVRSSVGVAVLVLAPRRRVAEAIVAVPMRSRSDRLSVLVANCVTLTPGTLTLDCVGDPAVLYIHVLRLRDADQVRADVHRLEQLAARAVGEPLVGSEVGA